MDGAIGPEPVCETTADIDAEEEEPEVCTVCWEQVVYDPGAGGIIACCRCKKEMHFTCAIGILDTDCPSCREPMFPRAPGNEQHGDVWTALEKKQQTINKYYAGFLKLKERQDNMEEALIKMKKERDEADLKAKEQQKQYDDLKGEYDALKCNLNKLEVAIFSDKRASDESKRPCKAVALYQAQTGDAARQADREALQRIIRQQQAKIEELSNQNRQLTDAE